MKNKNRLTLSGIFPFFHEERFDHTYVEALIKAECIMNDECTIPASFLISDINIASILARNIRLFEDGLIKISLRNSCTSLNDLAETKYGKHATDDLKKLSDYFDERSQFISFDPYSASSNFRERLLIFLESLKPEANGGWEIYSLYSLIEKVTSYSDGFTYNDSTKISSDIDWIDVKYRAAAKYFYCLSGAENVEGGCEIPDIVWRELFDNPRTAVSDFDQQMKPNLLGHAHNVVLEHFALSLSQLYRLDVDEIIEIKKEGATKETIKFLRDSVNSIKLSDGSSQSNAAKLNDIREAKKRISSIISERSLDEGRARAKIETGLSILDDTVPLVAEVTASALPMWGSIRKYSLKLGTYLSRETGISNLDITRTPIQTYVTRLQSRIATKPSEPNL